jgi:hypothetical protein
MTEIFHLVRFTVTNNLEGSAVSIFNYFILKLYATVFSKMLVTIYLNTWHHIPEENTLQVVLHIAQSYNFITSVKKTVFVAFKEKVAHKINNCDK